MFNLIHSFRDLLIATVVISGIIVYRDLYDKQSVKIKTKS